jgi:hypothetical protein
MVILIGGYLHYFDEFPDDSTGFISFIVLPAAIPCSSRDTGPLPDLSLHNSVPIGLPHHALRCGVYSLILVDYRITPALSPGPPLFPAFIYAFPITGLYPCRSDPVEMFA